MSDVGLLARRCRGSAASVSRPRASLVFRAVAMAVVLSLLSHGQPAVSEALSVFLADTGLDEIEAALAGTSCHAGGDSS